AGRVVVGIAPSGTFNTLGATGGSETQAITQAQLPNVTGHIQMHNGGSATNVWNMGGVFTGGAYLGSYQTGGTGPIGGANSYGQIHFSLGGLGEAHNNLQPYTVAYIWKRTA